VALARSLTEFLAILLAAWLATGLTLAVVMGRRGHGAFQWFFLGAILGPLAPPLAWSSIRDEGRTPPRTLAEGLSSSGAVDLLVGIDGSAEAATALRWATRRVGANIGRLMLASAVTFDETSGQIRREEERATELLEAAASSVEDLDPGRVLLSGQPADALIGYAIEEGYDVLAIGRRGRGASKALLGSTAARAADGPIPTLVV
jgi:nucleotide-binding universal stress UspA family protein